MTTRILFAGIFGCALVVAAGGRHFSRMQERLTIAERRLERFENPVIFANAQKVSRITGAPLYQVLTGKRLPTYKESER